MLNSDSSSLWTNLLPKRTNHYLAEISVTWYRFGRSRNRIWKNGRIFGQSEPEPWEIISVWLSRQRNNHSLYGSTNCCISDGPSQWEMAIFDSPLLRDHRSKFEIHNYLPDTTPHAQFQGAMSTWVVWANSKFDAWKFPYIFPFLVTDTGCILGRIPTHNTPFYVAPAFCGLERWKLKLDPLYP